VLGIDNLSLGQPAPAPRPGLVFEPLDVRDEPRMADALGGFRPEQIIHLAAIHHIPTCEARPAEALHVNVVGTQVVLQAAARAGCHRVTFASSGAVYAWGSAALNEERTAGVVTAARLFNTIGPGDRNGHLVPDLMSQLRGDGGGGERLVKIGNTQPMRDYVYVDDVARGLQRMIEAELAPGFRAINLGSGVEHPVTAIVAELAAIAGVRYRLEVDPARVRRVDRLHQCADISLAAALLGWRPQHALGDALRRTVTQMISEA
jgi:UDP-glucose 4-epimerase